MAKLNPPSVVPLLAMVKVFVTIWCSLTRRPKSTTCDDSSIKQDGSNLWSNVNFHGNMLPSKWQHAYRCIL